MELTGNKRVETQLRHCNIVFYNGTLHEYATEILAQGRGNGSVYCVCEIAPEIIADMNRKGKELFSNDIIITQRQIFKYRSHPKATKGASLPLSDYYLIKETLRNPTHIYEDIVQKRLVYVYTHPYHDKHLIKVVVEPNFKTEGTILNMTKSWGIVEKTKMKGPQYRQIK